MELAKIELPAGEVLPPDAAADVRQASEDLKRLHRLLAVEEERRRFANDSLTLLAEPVGYTSGYFHAGPLILTHRRQGTEWQWSVTPHYPLVSRLPPDPQYIALAYGVALQQMKALTLPTDVFGRRLRMAWMLARHFAANEDVPVSSVMKMYQIAGQDDSFWQSPRRNLYRDLPEAAFVINILSWRRQAADVSGFEFVPATLAQATQKDVFFMPMNVAGTEVRPMIYLRYRPQA